MTTIWWCPVCSRTYRDGQQRKAGSVRLCAYPDCNCWADIAQIDWNSIRQREPMLPVVPEVNKRYQVEDVVWK
jgi:hypothetical protein